VHWGEWPRAGSLDAARSTVRSADVELPAAHFDLIEPSDGLRGLGLGRKRDERKPAGAPRLAARGQVHVHDASGRGQQEAELFLGGFVSQVADEYSC
jgi:hypothetical protein